MARKIKFYTFERIGTNTYKKGNKLYRLFAGGVTPNGCWLIDPRLVRLLDINIATGRDVYGAVMKFDLGEVSATGRTYL